MSLTILIVDDSAVMRAMITRTLRISGLPIGTLLEAVNGEAGLATTRTQWVDLVLADLNMPVMGGEAMIDAIQRDTGAACPPMIVISSDTSDSSRQRLRHKGVGFLPKPFTPERLRSIVLTTLGLDHARLAYSAAATSSHHDF